jgi:multiple sugar transport system substrate-binding protein
MDRGGTASFAEAAVDWKQFAGTTITATLNVQPWSTGLKNFVAEFEKLTGITVVLNLLGEAEYKAKVPLELAAHSATPTTYDFDQMGEVIHSGWAAPLDEFIADPSLTDKSWFDMGDFFPAPLAVGSSGGKLYGLPHDLNVQVLWARKDLVPRQPETFEELIAAAANAQAKASKAGVKTHGIGMRSKPDESTWWSWAGFLFSYGGELVNAKARPSLNSAASIASAELYGKLLRDYGAPGGSEWGWEENQAAFTAGAIAMFPDAMSFGGTFLSPHTNKYADQTVMYRLPSHNGVSRPDIATWLQVINPRAPEKEQKAAWLFIEWALSKATFAKTVAYSTDPPRKSSYGLPVFRKLLGGNVSTAESVLSGADGVPYSYIMADPTITPVLLDVGIALNSIIIGKESASAAMASAQRAAAAGK